MSAIVIDGTDLRDALGLVVSATPQLFDQAPLEHTEIRIANEDGIRIPNSIEPGRAFALTGYLKEATVALAQARLDSIAEFLDTPDERVLQAIRRPGRQLHCRRTSFRATPVDPVMESSVVHLEVGFAVTSPFWYSTSETTVGGITTTPTSLPAGSADIRKGLRARVQGAAMGPIIITIRDKDDVIVSTVEFELSLSSAPQYLCIDFEHANAFVNTTGNWGSGTNVLTDWVRNQPWLDRLRKTWWNRALSDWVKVSVNVGTLEFRYRQAWR